jgi:CRISPR system Cascade subunit CasE
MRDVADVTGMHKRLMRAFPNHGDDSARLAMGILFRMEFGVSHVTVYVQSDVEPDWSLLEARSFLEPPHVKNVESAIESIHNGQVLMFRLKANPVKRLKVPGKKNGRKVGLVREEDQAEWLNRRAAESGFSVVGLTIRKEGLLSTRDGKAFESVVFDGVLSVVDAERFLACVRSGIGSGKAYGFGMLSVAPYDSGQVVSCA